MSGIPYHAWTHRRKSQGGTDPVSFAALVRDIKIFADDQIVTVGDGKFIFPITEDMDGLDLVWVELWITDSSSSGIVQVQIRNVTQADDILSTRVQIDQGDLHSDDSGTPYVIDTGEDEAVFKEFWSIDVDAAGTGAGGLGISLGWE